MQPKKGDTIVVWFSCGAASAVAAKKTIERYGQICTVRVVNNPIKEEGEDNPRFLKDIEKWLGITIETAINPKFPNCSIEEVWEKRKFMSGVRGAICTKVLKKDARYEWERNNHYDWLVLGFDATEKSRYDDFVLTERQNTLFVLGDEQLTKEDCFSIILSSGIELPASYLKGYLNANCPGCPKATSPTYWNHVRKVDPEIFEKRAIVSRKLGVRLVRVKGKRIFLDELDPDAKGRPMKSLHMECGIFCEERPSIKISPLTT
jgi:hypothetical protein